MNVIKLYGDLFSCLLACFSICVYFLILDLLSSYMFFLSVYLCTMCMPDTHRGQKRVSNPLELELWMVVNHHVGAGSQACIL